MSLNINNKDHVMGSLDAPVILIEYADYQCPYCREAYAVVKKAQKELGENLAFVFRNFPLTELHPHALHAAIAAEIAAGYGKFWQMHDMLFENQQNLDDNYLIEYAEELDIDSGQFEEDFAKDQYIQKIKADLQSGTQNDVEGTPTFFVNGKAFEGNWMSYDFIRYLNSQVK